MGYKIAKYLLNYNAMTQLKCTQSGIKSQSPLKHLKKPTVTPCDT